MKAWGSKKILRGEDVARLETWRMDQFSGSSVQRPHVRAEPVPVEAPIAQPAPVLAAGEVDGMESGDASRPADEVIPIGPTPEEIEAIRAAAHQEGFGMGHEAGRQAGYAVGEQAGREAGHAAGHASGLEQGRQAAAVEVDRFRTLLAQLESAVQGYEARLAQPIMDLSLAVAKQVLRTTLSLEPERIQAVIREAINSLPELQGPLRLDLHPEDVSLVHGLFADGFEIGQWRFEADETIERGGCRISNPTIEVDLTLPVRWRRIVEALGRDDAWTDQNDNA
jgi:flagellar assembly protein FliH